MPTTVKSLNRPHRNLPHNPCSWRKLIPLKVSCSRQNEHEGLFSVSFKLQKIDCSLSSNNPDRHSSLIKLVNIRLVSDFHELKGILGYPKEICKF